MVRLQYAAAALLATSAALAAPASAQNANRLENGTLLQIQGEGKAEVGPDLRVFG